MPIVQIFADFSTKKTKENSDRMIKILEELKPNFEMRFKFVWTDDE